MKTQIVILFASVLIFAACNTVKVINTDTEPVPVKVTNQPIQTTITNDLSSVKVNNTSSEPIPVNIINGGSNNEQNRIYFRMRIPPLAVGTNTMTFEIKQEHLISGTLPTTSYNYMITSAFGSPTNNYLGVFYDNTIPLLYYPVNTLLFLPFNSSDKVRLQPNNVHTITGYIFK